MPRPVPGAAGRPSQQQAALPRPRPSAPARRRLPGAYRPDVPAEDARDGRLDEVSLARDRRLVAGPHLLPLLLAALAARLLLLAVGRGASGPVGHQELCKDRAAQGLQGSRGGHQLRGRAAGDGPAPRGRTLASRPAREKGVCHVPEQRGGEAPTRTPQSHGRPQAALPAFCSRDRLWVRLKAHQQRLWTASTCLHRTPWSAQEGRWKVIAASGRGGDPEGSWAAGRGRFTPAALGGGSAQGADLLVLPGERSFFRLSISSCSPFRTKPRYSSASSWRPWRVIQGRRVSPGSLGLLPAQG